LNRFLGHRGLGLATLAILACPRANAEPIVAGVASFPIAAIQNVELLPGAPFNPSGSSIVVTDLTAVGGISIDHAAQFGSTIGYTGIDAYFTAASSPIGPFELGAGPTIGFGGFSGKITNVVQNPLDPGYATGQPSSFVSGDFLADVSQFGLKVGGQLFFTIDPDLEFTDRDSASHNLTFTSTTINSSFTAANSVLNGIQPIPNFRIGGDGPVTAPEVQFNVGFHTPFSLSVGHYFFVSQVQLSSGDFFWLSAPEPIVSPGTPFSPDIQT
jgi:hypothetical protein